MRWQSVRPKRLPSRLEDYDDARCHAPNRFGTVNMEDNINIKRS